MRHLHAGFGWWWQELRFKFGEFTVSVAAALAGIISLASGLTIISAYVPIPNQIIVAYDAGLAVGGVALLVGILTSILHVEAFGYAMLAIDIGFLGIARCLHFVQNPAGAVFFLLVGIWMTNRFFITRRAIRVLEKRHA
ncbi:MAG: hypothetical protein ACRDMV_18160 [Streptosporangiales bacterium]